MGTRWSPQSSWGRPSTSLPRRDGASRPRPATETLGAPLSPARSLAACAVGRPLSLCHRPRGGSGPRRWPAEDASQSAGRPGPTATRPPGLESTAAPGRPAGTRPWEATPGDAADATAPGLAPPRTRHPRPRLGEGARPPSRLRAGARGGLGLQALGWGSCAAPGPPLRPEPPFRLLGARGAGPPATSQPQGQTVGGEAAGHAGPPGRPGPQGESLGRLSLRPPGAGGEAATMSSARQQPGRGRPPSPGARRPGGRQGRPQT